MKQAAIYSYLVYWSYNVIRHIELIPNQSVHHCLMFSQPALWSSSDCGGLQQHIILQLPHANFVIPNFMYLFERVLQILLQLHIITFSM